MLLEKREVGGKGVVWGSMCVLPTEDPVAFIFFCSVVDFFSVWLLGLF